MKSLLQFLRQLQFWLCSGQMHYIHGADTLPPPLSAPEERAMLEALANGNTDAREQLIVHNLRLVVYIAKKFESTGIGLEDLISIGTIRLVLSHW
jgi:RNA polymerase sporulation-specific sigma factor